MVSKARSMGGVVAVALAIAAAACGGGGGGNTSGVVSCTLTDNASNVGLGLLQICEEVPAADRQQIQQSCMLPAGSLPPDAGISASAQFVDGPCSHVNALGGCRVTNGPITETVWYYSPGDAGVVGQTSSDIQSLCAMIGAAYVAP